jgi:hypothetical protein
LFKGVDVHNKHHSIPAGLKRVLSVQITHRHVPHDTGLQVKVSGSHGGKDGQARDAVRACRQIINVPVEHTVSIFGPERGILNPRDDTAKTLNTLHWVRLLYTLNTTCIDKFRQFSKIYTKTFKPPSTDQNVFKYLLCPQTVPYATLFQTQSPALL